MVSNEGQVALQAEVLRGDEMRTPDEVAAMLRLKALGWGIKRIARELGCSHMTVRRYVAEGGYVVFRRPIGRPRALAGLDVWWPSGFGAIGQCRCRASGTAGREGHRAQFAHGRAGGSASSPRSRGGGACDHSVRDATRPPAADRLRRATHRDRGRADQGVPVRGDAGVLAPDACSRLPQRAAGELARDAAEVPERALQPLVTVTRTCSPINRHGTEHALPSTSIAQSAWTLRVSSRKAWNEGRPAVGRSALASSRANRAAGASPVASGVSR